MNTDDHFLVRAALTAREPLGQADLCLGGLSVRLSGGHWHHDPGTDLHLLVRGTLYSHTPAEVLKLYRDHGPASATRIEGNALLVIVDGRRGELQVITDRPGSVKAFTASQDGVWYLSSSLQLLLSQPELPGRALDPAGLGCYLVNGVSYGEGTLFQGVRQLARASHHQLTASLAGPTLLTEPYWQFRFAPEARPRADWHAELQLALTGAMTRRLAASRNPAVSLSAGYDARTILALMGRTLQVSAVRTFSYALGQPAPDSDPALSTRLAAHYSYAHRLVASYRHDLAATLDRNATWGDGTSPFCEEVNAWDELQAEGPLDVFTGDHTFGGAPLMHRSTLEDAAHFAYVLPWSALGPLSALMPQAELLEHGWTATRDRLLGQVAGLSSPEDRVDALYFDGRLQHSILPWREQFAGRTGRVHTPFLDTQVMDLVRRMPPRLRRDKTLFKAVARQLDPALFALPYARHSGYAANWASELHQHPEVVQAALARPSRLDAYLPPELIAMLASHRPGGSGTPRLRQHLARWRRSPALTRLLGTHPYRKQVRGSDLVLRALTFRLFEARLSDRQSPVLPAVAFDTTPVAI